jgi:hypothetical protein
MIAREKSQSASAEQRLKELGIELPAPPEPFGTASNDYIAVTRTIFRSYQHQPLQTGSLIDRAAP